MSGILRRIKPKHLLMAYLCVYAVVSFCFLGRFPFMHSDESWLSGLSRNMLASGSIGVTEPFFDLKPRYPHAIKTLFHLLQMLMFQVFGYELTTFRLLSLAGGLACLVAFHAILLRQIRHSWMALVGTILLSVDIQFLYASHFARSEILVLLCMLGCFFALTDEERPRPALAGVITGLCIGLHPNSFVVAGLCGSVLVLGGGPGSSRQKLQRLALYTSVVVLFALIVVGMCLRMDPDFFRHYYGEYGADYQVHGSLLEKLAETGPYFQRLFQQVSGTYYTPDIRLQLVLFGGALVASVALLMMKQHKLRPALSAAFGIWLAMALMGRYGQPYVVFYYPFGYLLVIQAISLLGHRRGLAAAVALTALVGWLCAGQVLPIAEQRESHDRYLEKIANVVPPDAKTLGNLNAEYHFEAGKLLDYRNLSFLQEQRLTLSEYLRSREVRYILYSNELELWHKLRPRWDHIYGDPGFVPELLEVLEDECTLLYQFVDNQYGNRVVSYQHTGQDFVVSIYRFDPAP